MIRTFVSFSGHTLYVDKSPSKTYKTIGDMAFTRNESLLLFLLQGRQIQCEVILNNGHKLARLD